MKSELWQKTYDGLVVSFFKLQLPISRTFQGRWIAWYESERDDHQPLEYSKEPSREEVEKLFTG